MWMSSCSASLFASLINTTLSSNYQLSSLSYIGFLHSTYLESFVCFVVSSGCFCLFIVAFREPVILFLNFSFRLLLGYVFCSSTSSCTLCDIHWSVGFIQTRLTMLFSTGCFPFLSVCPHVCCIFSLICISLNFCLYCCQMSVSFRCHGVVLHILFWCESST